MPIQLDHAQFNQFVQFALRQKSSSAIARAPDATGPLPLAGRGIVAARGDTVRPLGKRSPDAKRANDRTRELFAVAVAEMFGGAKKIPRSVLDVMKTEDYFQGKPLYAFGYGLSYTTYKYGRAKIKDNNIIIPVKNTGKRDGTEVVQVYVRRPADKNGPSKTLRIFRRVFIPAGETVKVCLPLEEETFLWWSEEKQDTVPLPGKYRLLYGGRSDKLRSKRYTFR